MLSKFIILTHKTDSKKTTSIYSPMFLPKLRNVNREEWINFAWYLYRSRDLNRTGHFSGSLVVSYICVLADPTMVTCVSAIRSIKYEGCEGACHNRRVRSLFGLSGRISTNPHRYCFFFHACFLFRSVAMWWIHTWYLI